MLHEKTICWRLVGTAAIQAALCLTILGGYYTAVEATDATTLSSSVTSTVNGVKSGGVSYIVDHPEVVVGVGGAIMGLAVGIALALSLASCILERRKAKQVSPNQEPLMQQPLPPGKLPPPEVPQPQAVPVGPPVAPPGHEGVKHAWHQDGKN